MSWTEDRVTLLKKLWGEGRTAAEIAKELGGVTRNAVIGKAHRLKLSNRVSPIQQNTKKSVKSADTKKPPSRTKAVLKREEDIKIIGVSMAELKERMCRWPIGDPREPGFQFCGCDSVAGLPYCDDHAKIAYQTSSRSRTLKAEDFEDRKKDKDDDMKEAVNG